MGRKEPADVRFWRKVDITPTCWLWTAGVNSAGYGAFNEDYHVVRAHQYAWALVNGPVPDGLQLNHHCHVRNCVRPSHLYAGTAADNTQDMVEAGRCRSGEYQAAKTHCPADHEYSPENTYLRPNGHRYCRICQRESVRASRKRRGATNGHT